MKNRFLGGIGSVDVALESNGTQSTTCEISITTGVEHEVKKYLEMPGGRFRTRNLHFVRKKDSESRQRSGDFRIRRRDDRTNNVFYSR